ncbi:MAG: pyruvate kinase, partial [Anaerolineae bacterium]
EMWQELLAAGVTAFRLNTSHLSLSQLEQWLEKLTAFFTRRDIDIPVVLDLQGSKWRLGDFPSMTLTEGQRVELVHATSVGTPGTLPVPHPDLFLAAFESNGEIVLNDARVRLMIESQTADSIQARVIQAGELSSRKGITFTASQYRKEALNEQDRSIVAQTAGFHFLRYALSYVKDAEELARYRAHFGPDAYLIAKLERQPAIDQAAEMTGTANELWLCRGDLGAELGVRAMAETAHHFSAQVKRIPAPVLLAGQVLEHMTAHPTPTRSEVCSLYDALANGYRGFVLSDEAAVGRYPVESGRVAAMFRG